MSTSTDVDLGEVRSIVSRAVKAAAVPAGEQVDGQLLASLRGALAVAKLAQDQAYGFARDLRGEGRSWAELADLLEIPWSEEYVRRERVYELVAGAYAGMFSAVRLYWTCGGPGGCGQYVTDHGPYDGHPDDTEDGHGSGCRRHAAEIEAYQQAQAEIEEQARVMDEAMEKVTDPFGQETVKRARYVLAHGGRYLGWSTSESLAVALVLQDTGQLKAQGYSTQKAAMDRVLNRPIKPADLAWLQLLRAAATGRK